MISFSGYRPYLLIVILGLLIYLPSLFYGFCYLDDNTLIIDNQEFISKLSNIPQAFQQPLFPANQPVMTLSLMLDAQITGISPFGYHATNIIIHLIVSCLVFWLLLKFGYHLGLALFGALIFTAHPLLSQSVAWVIGRNESLLALFIMLAFILTIKFVETNKWGYYTASLLAFALAIFTKESAMMFPIVSSLFILMYFGRDASGLPEVSSFATAAGRIRNIFTTHWAKLYGIRRVLGMLISGWLIVGAAWYMLRTIALVQNSYTPGIAELTKAMVRNSWEVWIFLGKTIIPAKLAAIPALEDSPFIYGYITLAIILGMILLGRPRQAKILIFGIAWFCLFLAPSIYSHEGSKLVFIALEPRIYLSFIGFLMIVLASGIVQRLQLKSRHQLVIGALIIIALAVSTAIRIPVYKDRTAFWASVVKDSPHLGLGHRILGRIYYDQGLLDQAEASYKKCLELDLKSPESNYGLGNVYLKRGMPEKANEYYKTSYYLWGNWHSENNNLVQALTNYTNALKIDQAYVNAYTNRGIVYSRIGDWKQALADFTCAIELSPGIPNAYNNRGLVWADLNQLDKAIADYSAAIKINPQYFQSYYNRSHAYTRKGDYQSAIADAETLLPLVQADPAWVKDVNNLLRDWRAKLK